MNKSKMYSAVIVAIFFLGMILFINRKPINASMNNSKDTGEGMLTAQKQTEQYKKKNEAMMINNRGSQKAPASALSTITKKEINTLRETLPQTAKVREEVDVDPHRTPPSLITFAKNLGLMMEKALNNKNDAGILINELYDCTNDDSVIVSARALCVSNAEKLAKAHPQIKDKAAEIRSIASPEVKKLLN